jgi:hypothetical protein
VPFADFSYDLRMPIVQGLILVTFILTTISQIICLFWAYRHWDYFEKMNVFFRTFVSALFLTIVICILDTLQVFIGFPALNLFIFLMMVFMATLFVESFLIWGTMRLCFAIFKKN